MHSRQVASGQARIKAPSLSYSRLHLQHHYQRPSIYKYTAYKYSTHKHRPIIMPTTLSSHFETVPADHQTPQWDKVWQKQITPWDRAAPSPALLDTLAQRSGILGSSKRTTGARKKALVPGCGRGYDVLLLASYGYDAYGLDVSPTALQAAARVRDEQGNDEGKYPLANGVKDRGRIEFVEGDFFADEFLEKSLGAAGKGEEAKFDLVYDYTFLCALPPAWRPRWSKRMAELVKKDGHLVCLEFPLHKDPKTSGPPHGLSSQLYVELLSRPGAEVQYNSDGYVKPSQSEPVSNNALHRVAHWKPERTHDVGQGHDRVSIWQHRTE